MHMIYDYLGVKVLTVNHTTPEHYGALGDGTTDDSTSIQNAVNNAGLIIFTSGKTYKVDSTVRIPANIIIDLNGATINCTTKKLFYNFENDDTFTAYNGKGNIIIRNGIIIGGDLSFAHGENIRLENLIFKNCLNVHILEICACKNYIIQNCEFIGMGNWTTSVQEYVNLDMATYAAFPWLPSGSAFYDSTFNDGIYVDNCKFSIGSDDWQYGYNAFGVHSTNNAEVHKNIVIKNSKFSGFTGCGIRLNAMQNVYVANNIIEVSGDGIRVGDIANCEDITIINNYIVSENGERIALTSGRYTDLTNAGNIIKGTIENS